MTNPDSECRKDFEEWCRDYRHLGRDRLWPAFRAGWAFGFGTGTDQRHEKQQPETTAFEL